MAYNNTDVYAYEATLEQQEEQKRMYLPMKQWYQTYRTDFQQQFGPFPSFWKDLSTWKPWKEVYRAYNVWIETPVDKRPALLAAIKPITTAPPNDNNTNSSTMTGTISTTTLVSSSAAVATASSSTVENTTTATANTEPSATDTAAPVRRKRARWGDYATTDGGSHEPLSSSATTVASSSSATTGSNPSHVPVLPASRRSRWMEKPTGSEILYGPVSPLTRQRNRWGDRAIHTALSLIPSQISVAQEALFLYRIRIEELQLKLSLLPIEIKRIENDPNRSPSPEPEYDSTGKRLNSREQVYRKKIIQQRTALLEKIMDLNPSLTGSSGPKFIRKLYIPWKEYPNYNFMGLIIGPRGNTQKKLEKETGCKISIRGRGSGKDGVSSTSSGGGNKNKNANKSSASHANNSSNNNANDPDTKDDDDDELHVHLSGDNLTLVEAAASLIDDLLHPIDDNSNDWKKQQLMELAALNGTLRTLNDPCSRCGEPGHRHYECPYAETQSRKNVIRCAICGDGSHVAADCKMKNNPLGSGNGDGTTNNGMSSLDTEYLQFMADVGDATAKARLAEIQARQGTNTVPTATGTTGGDMYPSNGNRSDRSYDNYDNNNRSSYRGRGGGRGGGGGRDNWRGGGGGGRGGGRRDDFPYRPSHNGPRDYPPPTGPYPSHHPHPYHQPPPQHPHEGIPYGYPHDPNQLYNPHMAIDPNQPTYPPPYDPQMMAAYYQQQPPPDPHNPHGNVPYEYALAQQQYYEQQQYHYHLQMQQQQQQQQQGQEGTPYDPNAAAMAMMSNSIPPEYAAYYYAQQHQYPSPPPNESTTESANTNTI